MPGKDELAVSGKSWSALWEEDPAAVLHARVAHQPLVHRKQLSAYSRQASVREAQGLRPGPPSQGNEELRAKPPSA